MTALGHLALDHPSVVGRHCRDVPVVPMFLLCPQGRAYCPCLVVVSCATSLTVAQVVQARNWPVHWKLLPVPNKVIQGVPGRAGVAELTHLVTPDEVRLCQYGWPFHKVSLVCIY